MVRHCLAMGTRLELRLVAPDRPTALAASEAALDAIDRAEARLSTWTAPSELAAVNRSVVGRWVPVSDELRRDLESAMAWARRTGGAFDPVVGSLVAAWGLRSGGRVPEPARLAEARANAGHGLVELGEAGIRRFASGAVIDEGGFGKGIGLRDALEAAVEAGGSCVQLDLGGQVAVSPGCGPVEVGIADPTDRGAVAGVLVVEGGSVATSGNSVRSFEVDGIELGHLLDPRIGAPAEDWGAVTVVARDPVAADCLATALFVMGPGDGLSWATATEGVEAVFAVVSASGQVEVKATPGADVRLPSRTGGPATAGPVFAKR